MSRNERFTCTIHRDGDGQVDYIDVEVADAYGHYEHISLNGSRASLLAPTLHQILREGGVTGRQWTTPRPIELDQGPGAQAWLLMTATRQLRRQDRIDEVSEGIASMSREEAAYWYAKAHQPRGLRAVRILLSDDTRRRQ